MATALFSSICSMKVEVKRLLIHALRRLLNTSAFDVSSAPAAVIYSIPGIPVHSFMTPPEKHASTIIREYRVILDGYDPASKVLEAAKLCKYVSEISNSKQNPSTGTTSTTLDGAKTGFNTLGYKYTQVDSFSMAAVKNSLDKCYPVYIAAGDKNNLTSTTGHAFVIRGYWDTKINVQDSPYKGDLAISLAINWGYMAGFGDGWYLAEIGELGFDFIGLTPLVFTDQGPAYSSHNWSRAIKLLTNVRPQNMN